MSQRPVCVIGNANPDIVMGLLSQWPEEGTEIFLDHCDVRPGGSAANTALVLRRLGVPHGLIAATGSDTMGDWLAGHFTGPLDRIARMHLATGISVGVLHPGAERSFLSFDGHLGTLDLQTILQGLDGWPLTGALALVSGGFALPALAPDSSALMTHLSLAEAEIAIDPGWPGEGWTDLARTSFRLWARYARHVLINDKELHGATGLTEIDAAAQTLLPLMPPRATLVVKCGAEGALAFRADGTRACAPAPATRPFDTVGAGDSFNAGYLAALSKDLSLQEALETGTATASRVIAAFPRNTGPMEPLPHAETTA